MAGKNSEATLLLRIKAVGQDVITDLKDRFVITAGDIVGAFRSATGAVVGFVKDSIEAYAEEERAVNALSQAMVTQGVFTSELRTKYLEMASALQKTTTFADEQIIAAQATLQSFIGEKEVTEELVKATLDLAAAKGIDLASASELVGKTIGSTTNALARQGIEITETTDKTARAAEVITKINGRYEGQAEALAKGLGAIEQAKNAWSDFMETVGSQTSPFAIRLANATTAVANFLSGLFGSDINLATAGSDQLKAKMIELSIELENLRVQSEKSPGMAKAMGLDGQISVLEQQIAAIQAKYNQIQMMEEDAKNKSVQNEKDRLSELGQAAVDAEVARQDRMVQLAIAEDLEGAAKTEKQIKLLDDQLKIEKDGLEKRHLLRRRYELSEQLAVQKQDEAKKKSDEEMVKNRASTLNTIATLQTSSNKSLALIGKAAALTEIAIQTPIAISRALAAFPPPFNYVAAGAVGAAMASQAARVAGVQLADGGIVSARPGGTPAIIGEGGRSEAVIPLPHDFNPEQGLGGGRTVINFYGPLMGDQHTAREFARTIDRELLTLRRNNESLAFDEGIV